MTFKSLNNVLDAIAKQPSWEKQRQYHQLVKHWRKVVNSKVAKYTRPLYLQRQILWVATPNSVWSQNLSLQRYSLLKKLNQFLEKPIIDIRFSSARWYQKQQEDVNEISNLSLHPSSLNIDLDFSDHNDTPIPTTPEEAFQKWMETLKRRFPYLVTCPVCHSPTPEGELKRWQMCACCFAKQFSQ